MEIRTNWNELDVVAQQIDRAAQYVADGAAERFRAHAAFCLDDTKGLEPWVGLESPLEATFYLWWLALGTVNPGVFNWVELKPQFEVVISDHVRFRLDFVLELVDEYLQRHIHQLGMSWPLIGVEVDGHAFHERTPEQVAYRDRRDRALQQAGWKIFHYSWSEVMSDPGGCVGEVFCYGRDMRHQISRLAGERFGELKRLAAAQPSSPA